MSMAELSRRISIDPKILHGQPAIKGTRIPVALILNLLEAGETWDAILYSYPNLTEADIRAAIHYAAELVKEEEVVAFEVMASSA